MAIKCRFNAEKAIEVLLYVAEKAPNMYNTLKVLYFADKDHLAKYGRLICDDSYVAMEHGPVPSGAYDLVKNARGDSCCFPHLQVPDAFKVDSSYNIMPRRKPNLDLLSESDRECLDAAISRYGHMPFPQLREISHQERAHQEADENDFISLETLVQDLPDGEDLLEYLRTN